MALGTAIAVATFFSAHVARWWGQLMSPKHFAAGSLPFRALEWRASLDEADVHLAIWFVVTAVLLAGVTSRRSVGMVCLGMVLVAAGIELMQPTLSTRNGEWGDLVGGVIGTTLALTVRWVAGRQRRRARSVALDRLVVLDRVPVTVGS